MTPSKLIPIALLSVGLAITTLSAPAEARRGGRPTTRNTNEIDIDYSFSVFDATPTETPIPNCSFGSNSCLFVDAVSDIEITKLDYGTGGILDKVTIGTPGTTFFEQTFTPGIPATSSVISTPVTSSDSFSLLTSWDGSSLSYTVTDSQGSPLEVKAFLTGSSSGNMLPFSIGFGLNTPGGAAPDDRLINSIDYIVDIFSGKESLPTGYTKAGIDEELPAFQAVEDNSFDPGKPSTEVPEGSSAAGLLAFGLIGCGLVQRQLRTKQAIGIEQ